MQVVALAAQGSALLPLLRGAAGYVLAVHRAEAGALDHLATPQSVDGLCYAQRTPRKIASGRLYLQIHA